MSSLFQLALGNDFERLHSRLQSRFALSSTAQSAQVGVGIMNQMSRGALAAIPVALFGKARRLQLPGNARDVRFDLANYAYLDSFGRETFAYSRRFHLPGGLRRFDDTMIYSDARGCIVNYLGSHQDIAADLHLEVTESGGLRMIGGAQRLYAGNICLPIPRLAAATADVIETWDEAAGRFTISVDINSRFSRLFGYRGWFRVDQVPQQAAALPAGALPERERETP